MAANIIIHIAELAHQPLHWLELGDNDVPRDGGVIPWEELATLAQKYPGSEPTVLLDGRRCRRIVANIPAKSKAHIRAAFPFTVEDQFATEVESLHFAYAMTSANQETVALVVDHATMENILQHFDAAAWQPRLITCDTLALPPMSDSLRLLLDTEQAWVRTPDAEAYTCDRQVLPQLLRSLHSSMQQAAKNNADDDEHDASDIAPDSTTLPKMLVLQSGDNIDFNSDGWERHNQTPSRLFLRHEPSDGSLLNRLTTLAGLAKDLSSANPINLLQGRFSRRTHSGKQWQQWRWPAVMASILAVLMLTQWTLSYWQLSNQVSAITSAQQTIYTRVFPGSKPRRPYIQMRAAARALGTQSKNQSFLPLLAKFSAARAEVPGIELNSIGYRAKRSELQVDFLAPDFATIETLQKALIRRGLHVTPGSSNASGNKYSGRFTIKEQG